MVNVRLQFSCWESKKAGKAAIASLTQATPHPASNFFYTVCRDYSFSLIFSVAPSRHLKCWQ